jgi:aspartyl-tRNA(Asn)/glutamyl-tRNA(Gln) amidotransferase subunit A
VKTILEAAAALRARKVSSRELVFEALGCIAASNLGLRAFITVLETSAQVAAAQADDELAAGIDRGPLHGIPVALKDLFHVRGVPTTAGSKVLADFIPDRDSEVTRRLTAAGAVIVGKTNLHEIAYGITSSNPHYGTVRNPWDTDRIPGGSSGGSAAAVADGMALMAMGTDTGGSIRIPASYCGLVGFKPTYGSVSREGIVPLGFSLDHAGPITATVRDCAVTWAALTDAATAEDSSIRGVRVGVPENFYFDRVQPEVASAVLRAARTAQSLGAEVVSVRVPDMDFINATARAILLAEAAAAYEPWRDRRAEFGPDVRALLDQGRLLPAVTYVNAQRARRRHRREFARLWEQIDFLFTPTTPITAPRIGETTVEILGEREDVRMASTRLVRAINLLGVPALSMPCGADNLGLPIGLQIVGPAGEDAALLRFAAAVEGGL